MLMTQFHSSRLVLEPLLNPLLSAFGCSSRLNSSDHPLNWKSIVQKLVTPEKYLSPKTITFHDQDLRKYDSTKILKKLDDRLLSFSKRVNTLKTTVVYD